MRDKFMGANDLNYLSKYEVEDGSVLSKYLQQLSDTFRNKYLKQKEIEWLTQNKIKVQEFYPDYVEPTVREMYAV